MTRTAARGSLLVPRVFDHESDVVLFSELDACYDIRQACHFDGITGIIPEATALVFRGEGVT